MKPIYKTLLLTTIFIILSLTATQTAQAQATFDDTADGNWNAAGTWTLIGGADADGIPDADDTALIGSHTVTLDADSAADTVTISAGGTLSVTTDDRTLTVGSDLIINGGNITAAIGTFASFTINATNVNHTSGTITVSASGPNGTFSLLGTGTFTLSTIDCSTNMMVVIGNASNIPSSVAINGTISFSSSLSIYSSGNITQAGNISGGSSTTLRFSGASNFTYTSGTVNTSMRIYASSITIDNAAGEEIDEIPVTKLYLYSTGAITINVPLGTASFTTMGLYASNGTTSGDISFGGSGSVTLSDSGELFYQQASTITYNNGNINGEVITGCTTGELTLTSTANQVVITQATLGNVIITVNANGAGNNIGNVNAGALILNQQATAPTYNFNAGSTITLNSNSNPFSIEAGATVNANSSTISVAHHWTNNGTFNGDTSTVTLSGSSTLRNIIMAAGSFNNLIIGAGATRRVLIHDLVINGTFNQTGATFMANGTSVTVAGLATLSGTEYQASTAKQTFNGGLTISGETLTCSSGEVEVNGTLTISSGTLAGSTGELDVNGNVALSGTGILTAPSGTFNVSGNWDNNGTFIAGGGTLTLESINFKTFEAGASDYNNIQINMTNASDARDNLTMKTDSVTINGTLTITDGELIQDPATDINITTGAVSLVDASSKWTNHSDGDVTLSGNVSNAGTIDFNGETGDGIQIRSSAAGTRRNWTGAGTFTMEDVDVKDQSCPGPTPASITVTSGTDNGNNVNWIFGANTVSGTVYNSIGGATQDGVTVTIAIYDTSTGLISYYTDVTAGGGLYSITDNTIDTGDIIVAYLDDIANEATAVTKANANGSNIANLHLYYNAVDIRDEGGGITNTDLGNLDSVIDDDIKYTIAGVDLTIISGFDLYINSGDTFIPGGNVTVSNDWRNDGTFTAGAFTVIFDGTDAQTISGTNIFNAVTLNTRAAGTVGFTGDTTIPTLTVNGAGAYDVSFTGTTNTVTNAVTFSNTGTVTLGDGAGDSTTFTGGVTATAPSGISLAGTIATTNNTMTLGDADTNVTLTAATTLNSAGGTITCGGTTNGAFSLNVTSGAGTITFGDTIGNASALASLTIDNTGSVANFSGATNSITGTLTKQGTGDVNVGANGLTTGGLTITAGTFNNAADDSGTWDINGNVNVTGTLNATSGNFFVSGNVNFTGGTFSAGSGTFIFDGVTALTSDGEILNNVQIGSAGSAGALTLIDTANIDGNLTVENGGATTLDLGGQTLFFSGSTFNLTNLDTLTEAGSTVTFNGGALQTVTSISETYNIITVTNASGAGVVFADDFTTATLNAITPNTTLTFNAGDTYTITGAAGLNLDGQALGTEVTILSDNPSSQFTFNVTGGAQTVDYVNVTDSAASGNDITATNSINGGGNDDGTGTPEWVFGAVTRYWVSAVDQDWDDNNNWALTSGGAGGVNFPTVLDTAIFDGNGAGNCIIDANVDVNVIELQGAADPNGAYAGRLDASGFDITVNATLDITGGELELDAGSDLETDGALTIDGGTLDGLNGTINADNNIILSAGTLTAPSTNFSIFGDFTISGGAFAHSSGTVIFDGNTTLTSNGQILNNVQIGSAGSTGALTLIDTVNIDGNLSVENGGATTLDLGGQTVLFSGSTFNLTNLDTFTEAGSTVTFDGAALQTVTSISETYNTITITNASGAGVVFADDFTTATLNAITPNTTLTFNAGDTYTITGAAGLNLDGQAIGTEVTILSDNPGNPFTFDVTGGAQTVNYVHVTDSNADGNNITATNSVNNGGNDDAGPIPHWIFSNVTITVPSSLTTVGETPTIIGTAPPGNLVIIKGTVGVVPFQQVASATADANGNYRVMQSDYTAPVDLDTGPNNIRAEVGVIQSAVVNINVVAAPNFDQVPTIISPIEGASITSNPFTVNGFAVANTEVKIQALDVNGNLVLNCGSTTSDAVTGAYSISCDAVINALAAGTNTLTVTTYDGAGDAITTSDTVTVTFTDPFGIVFDSVSNNPIGGATVTLYYNGHIATVAAGELAPGDVNPVITGANGAFAFNVVHPPNADLNMTVTASGYAFPTTKADADLPAGRVILNPASVPPGGSKGEIWAFAGAITNLDLPMDPNNQLITINKEVNKKEVVIGDILTYTVTIRNQTASDVTNVYLEDMIPAGFKYINDRAILDDIEIADPTGNRPVLFNIGTVSSGQTRVLKYQLVVGSGVTTGNYENSAVCKYLDGTVISNEDSETVKIVLDPLFDLGTIIGKVFWDRNEDGKQTTPKDSDKSEPTGQAEDRGQKTEIGISGVQIVMEDGTIVTTDANGQYHIPAIIPGRHVVRINEMTLSKGAYLTTNKVVIVDITSGILAKVNFGVSMKDRKQITEDRGHLPARLLASTRSGQASARQAGKTDNQNETILDNEVVNEIISKLEEEQGDISDMPSEKEQITESVDGQYNSLSDEPANTSENHLLFVAMGDAEVGYNFNKGNMEPVEDSDRFKDGFYSEGKFAYYLKGKIKGKYLITSSLDTERDKKELFRKLDPDKYYPVYGDESTINYDATNTQGVLYLLIEWDKSSVLWGNYTTGLTDSEFAQFSRTLYGGKVHLESASTTKFGEPNTKLIVFDAQIKQRVSHNEFLGTGGSLYYLRNTNVIEGSEKVKIEIRDKITGLVLSSKQMQEGLDYEIDYDNGRIIFWQPVSQITASNSIISSHILDGNPVYVVVDYEYETKDEYDRWTYGARLKQSLTDYVTIGGTYVEEKQPDKDYQLKGVDATIRLGENIKITAEQAESISEQAENFVSTDGGLTFTALPTADKDKGTAYGIKATADFDKWGWVGYYKKFDEGFSSTSTIYQQGKELFGTGFVWDIDEQTTLALSHDIQKLSDDTNLQAQLQTGAEETRTSIAQLTHQIEKIKVTGEYRHQETKEKLDQFEAQTNKNEDTVALKADYELTEKVGLSIEQQTTLKGKTNNQTSVGLSAKPNEHLSINAKQTAAADSSATSMGITASVEDKILRTAFTVADDEEGRTQSVVVGSQQKLSDDLSLTTDKTYAKNKDTLTESNTFGLTKEKDEAKLKGTFTQQKAQNAQEFANTNIFGLSSDINNNWALAGSFEHGTVQNHDGTQATRNAGAVGIGYKDSQMKASSKLEFRGDAGEQDKEQYLIYNAVEYKPTINATLFAKTNISGTRNLSDNFTEAQYKELAAGVAYRPVYFDRVNLLAKYAYLEDNSSPDQSDFEDVEEERTHTVGGELAYDLTDKLQLVEKLAYKFGEEKVTGFDFTKTQTWLNIHRLNYNIDSDWQIGAEYRILTQKEAEDCKQGALLEVNRKIGQFVQLGVGYNFTEFNDDLTHLDYTSQGPFVRLTATIYDRTPEEIEQARQQALEQNIKVWVSQLIDEQLNNETSPVMQKLNNLYRTAQKLQAEGRMKEARELYEQIITTGNMLYNDAEEYIRQRIKLEEKLKKDNELALQYYEQGRLQEAKQLWEKMIQEAEPKTILWKY